MKKVDKALAADLISCLEGLKESRVAAELGPQRGGVMSIEIGAFEFFRGDTSHGHDYGGALLPVAVGTEIIDAAEKIIRDKLKALGVSA